MFGFKDTPQKTCGVIIDVGSGSVGAAIIISNAVKQKPDIIWSHREHVLIKDIASTDVSMKEITTSIINIFLQLGSDGSKKLHAVAPDLAITSIQVTISAPWTYTVTKRVNFNDEHPFEVDTELIEELSKAAENQAFSAVLESEVFQKSQLEIIDNKTIGITVNGYSVPETASIKTREISLAHITAIAHKKIITVLEESRTKMFPKSNLVTHSFMYAYYDVLKNLNPDTAEACIIDVTSEATEIGIIREGILTHVTHIAYGTFSIAREIALLCKIPKDEAYTYIKGGTSFVETKLSASKKAELDIIIEGYEDRVTELLKTTGDTLSIPKTVFLHTDAATEPFFVHHIEKAARKATAMNHTIHPITSLLFEEPPEGDTALLLSAHLFHKEHGAATKITT